MSEQLIETKTHNVEILVVDDLPSARKIVVRMLGQLGFTNVTEAARGSEAFAKLKNKPCDLVITDLHLQDSLGTELLEQVREDRGLNAKNIPFIIITSDMDKSSFAQAVKAGATSYLLKPFSVSILAERIASSLTLLAEQQKMA